MNQKNQQENRRVVFRRIGGRVVPISVAAGGGLIAADAARTTRVAETRRYAIDRKRFAFQPFQRDPRNLLGDQLVMRSAKTGKTIGQARFVVDAQEKTGKFSWLGIKRPFRGMGLSKQLSAEAAIEMKRAGAKSVMNHVVHPGSLLTNFDGRRDRLWRELYEKKDGTAMLERVDRDTALRSVKRWRNAIKRADSISWTDWHLKGKKKQIKWGARAIFRETSLRSVPVRRAFKPYMTTAMKTRLGIGLGLLAAGTAWAAMGRGNQ